MAALVEQEKKLIYLQTYFKSLYQQSNLGTQIFRAQYLLFIFADILLILVALVGLVIYARYKDCDPLFLNGIGRGGIKKGDQVGTLYIHLVTVPF